MSSLPGGKAWLLAIVLLLAAAVAGIPSLRAAVTAAATGLLANEIALFIVGSFLVIIVAAIFVNLAVGKLKDFGGDLHNSVWIWR